jgi:hypothetical protein
MGATFFFLLILPIVILIIVLVIIIAMAGLGAGAIGFGGAFVASRIKRKPIRHLMLCFFSMSFFFGVGCIGVLLSSQVWWVCPVSGLLIIASAVMGIRQVSRAIEKTVLRILINILFGIGIFGGFLLSLPLLKLIL